MTIAALLKAGLAADSGITAIVGTRIYPLVLSDNNPTLPAITYQRISNTAQKGTSDLRESRWQFSCWSKRREGGNGYQESQQLAAAVKTFLEEFNSTAQTPGIKQTLVVNENDDYDDEAKVYRVIIDVILYTTGD